jgi:L-iditol 2-dehydrogenase
MKAAKFYGPHDFRIENVPEPAPPGAGTVVIRVGTVGVCGSDLHTYADGRIGDTVVKEPVVLGHEFAGTVVEVGPEAWDGLHEPLAAGRRVAVDPAIPCWHCDRCEAGHPNLCRNLKFMGLYPDDGALQEYFAVPARCCFPIPDSLTLEEGALLEPLGVAIHAVDLGKLEVARSVAILGCGPIGLLVLALAKLSGAAPIYTFDQFPWRLDAACQWGADEAINIRENKPVAAIHDLTSRHGVDVVFEAAWGAEATDQAMRMADLGGRVVLIGIPSEDTATFTHSVARRKGLTIALCRRMKHTYPRAIQLAASGKVSLDALVSHRFDLEDTGQAFALNAAYEDNIIKAMVEIDPASR